MIECKSVGGNTFPFSNLSQYDLLRSYQGTEGVYPAVVIWFIDHDKIIYAPIAAIVDMKNAGKKSINIKNLDGLKVVPSVKKRVYLTADYSFLSEEM